MAHSQRDIEIGQRVPGTVGDQGFLGDRGGELERGYVHLLHPRVPNLALACPSM
jgi:hypothetical protein